MNLVTRLRRPIGRFLRSRPRMYHVYCELLRLCHEFRWTFAVLRDLRRAWSGLLSLREIPQIENGPVVLLVSLTESIYQVKLDAMFGVALKRNGWRPVALLHSRLLSGRQESYFRAFGIVDFVYLDEFQVGENDEHTFGDIVEDLLRSGTQFDRVKDWAYDGIWIGPQIISTIARHRFVAHPELTDSVLNQEVRDQLVLMLSRINQARKVISEVQPALAVSCEVNYSLYAPFADSLIAREVDVIQYTQPWRDDAFMCKRRNGTTRRDHPSSVSPQTLTEFTKTPWTDDHDAELEAVLAKRYSGEWFLQSRNQPGRDVVAKDRLLRDLDLDPDRKTVVVFSHVLWDANLFFGRDLFSDYGEWFIETVRTACDNPRANWIIKLHPGNLWKRRRMNVAGRFPEERLINEKIDGNLPNHVRFVAPDTEISAPSWYRSADYLITVRGTAGMEAPCFGTTVITAGTGRYSGLGFTVDPDTREAYLRTLGTIETLPSITPEQIALARRHAYVAFCKRPWRMESFRAEFTKDGSPGNPLEANLHPSVRATGGADGFGDLDKWAEWAVDRRRPDYFDDVAA